VHFLLAMLITHLHKYPALLCIDTWFHHHT
jgi:hypothetical protein